MSQELKSKENIEQIKNQLDINLQKIIKNRSVSNPKIKKEIVSKSYASLKTVEKLTLKNITIKTLKKLRIIISKIFTYILISLAILAFPLLLLRCFIIAIIPYMGGSQSCFNIFK